MVIMYRISMEPMEKYTSFIAPVGAARQGNYEPVTVLVTPKKQQLVNLGLDYAVDKNTLFKSEVAMSNYDANTFSKIDNGMIRDMLQNFK